MQKKKHCFLKNFARQVKSSSQTKTSSIYSRGMHVPITEYVRQLRSSGKVPLGIISYDVQGDGIDIAIFPDVDNDEARVILSKFGLGILITEKEE